MFIRLFVKTLAALGLLLATESGVCAEPSSGVRKPTPTSIKTWFDRAFTTYLAEYEDVKGCIKYSAKHFALDKELLVAVLMTEQGLSDPVRENNNGTFDLGIYQINQVRLGELADFEVTPKMLVTDHCVNSFMAAYLLNKEINEASDYWTGVGNYHYGSWGKYPKHHYQYIQKVYSNWLKLAKLN